jgi:OOP family OmpA-OmpF porin
VNYGDGSGVIDRGGATTVNYGDGSGTFHKGTLTVVNYGDGSGTYSDTGLEIHNYGDGSGTYAADGTTITIYGDGSGTYEANGVEIHNYGDGSALYTAPGIEIHNYGDGSAVYTAPGVDIHNYGEGTGTINGRSDVPMDPVAKVPPIGKLPPMKSIKPLGTECGTLIRLGEQVLFDFDQATLRAEAGPVLDKLAAALKGATGPLQVNGHTDALGSDSYNLDLSRKRAEAVAAALRQRGVTAEIVTHGYGETQPIAQNTLNGKDNPAGRQLNRRVEIVIPGA